MSSNFIVINVMKAYIGFSVIVAFIMSAELCFLIGKLRSQQQGLDERTRLFYAQT